MSVEAEWRHRGDLAWRQWRGGSGCRKKMAKWYVTVGTRPFAVYLDSKHMTNITLAVCQDPQHTAKLLCSLAHGKH